MGGDKVSDVPRRYPNLVRCWSCWSYWHPSFGVPPSAPESQTLERSTSIESSSLEKTFKTTQSKIFQYIFLLTLDIIKLLDIRISNIDAGLSKDIPIKMGEKSLTTLAFDQHDHYCSASEKGLWPVAHMQESIRNRQEKSKLFFSSHTLSVFVFPVLQMTTKQSFPTGSYPAWSDLSLFTKSYYTPIYILNPLEPVYIPGF